MGLVTSTFLKLWNVSERIWMMLAQYSVSTRLWMEFILIQTKFTYKGLLLNYAMHICTHIAQPYSIGVLKFMLNLVTTTDGVFHAQYPEVSSIFKVSDNAFLSTSMGRLNIPCPSPLPQQHKKVGNIRALLLSYFCPFSRTQEQQILMLEMKSKSMTSMDHLIYQKGR